MQRLEFNLKGQRTYIQGPDVYNKISNFIDENCTNFELSFHQIMENNIILSEKKPTDLKDLYFACSFMDNGIKKELYGLKDENSKPSKSFPYPEEEIIKNTKLVLKNKSIILEKNTGFSLIEEIVAMHKHLLSQIFANKEGKWYFAKIIFQKLPKGDVYPLKVSFKSNFNFLLVKSEIAFNPSKTLGGGILYFGSKKENINARA